MVIQNVLIHQLTGKAILGIFHQKVGLPIRGNPREPIPCVLSRFLL
jgi:hypothetical protein